VVPQRPTWISPSRPEILCFTGAYFGQSAASASAAPELLDKFKLTDRADHMARTLLRSDHASHRSPMITTPIFLNNPCPPTRRPLL